MHRRRGYNAQRGSHVHEVFYHVSHSGRYIRAPHEISTFYMYHPAIAGSRYKSLGSLYTPCPRPGQATAIAATLSQTACQPAAWTNNGFPARCLRALITTWQSRLVSSRQPGDDGSNCQVKVGIPHETNRTLNLQCLSRCYLPPFSHAWPAPSSFLLSSKVSASSTISGSPFPLHYAGQLHLSHQVYYTMPSRPQNSPFISAIHSLPIPNLITRYLPPHRLLQPVFAAPSRLSTVLRNQQACCSGLALLSHPA